MGLKNKDFISLLIHDLLLNIISQLGINDFLSLNKSSKYFNHFMNQYIPPMPIVPAYSTSIEIIEYLDKMEKCKNNKYYIPAFDILYRVGLSNLKRAVYQTMCYSIHFRYHNGRKRIDDILGNKCKLIHNEISPIESIFSSCVHDSYFLPVLFFIIILVLSITLNIMCH